jgi:exosome complex RNA-binding protein Rrp42 (RNase PH superfamily)
MIGKTNYMFETPPFPTRFRVLAVVDAKMVKPAPDRPYEGMINIHSEISPMASSEYEQGRYLICSLSQLVKRLLTQTI